MNILIRFLIFNLALSLMAGLLAWLIVLAAVRLLRIRSSSLSFCFYSLPIIKSLLVLLGVGLVFPWPAAWFEKWHELALPFRLMLPIFLAWSTGSFLVYHWVSRKARQAALRDALPASEVEPRLVEVYEAVLGDFKKAGCLECKDDLCCPVTLRSDPCLLVSRRLSSPLALVDHGTPTILFPASLAARLTDAELGGALAHELAHFYLRRRSWCSVGVLHTLTWIDPIAGLTGEYLNRQEEKACDALAVSALGQPEIYSGMLTKSYRYAVETQGGDASDPRQILPRLVGFRPLLSERVESLLDSEVETQPPSAAVAWLVWSFLLAILLFNLSFIPS